MTTPREIVNEAARAPRTYHVFEPSVIAEVRANLDRNIDARMNNFIRESISGVERGVADYEAGRIFTQEEVDEFLEKE